MMRYLLLAALLPWLCCACTGDEEAGDALKQEILRVQTNARILVNDSGNYWHEYTRQRLIGEESKKKFLPLIDCLDSLKQTSSTAINQLELGRREIAQAGNKKALRNELIDLEENLDELKERLRFHYTNFLQTHGEVFHIREKTKKSIQQYLDEVVAPLSPSVLWENFLLLTDVDQKIALQGMILDWESTAASLVNHLGAGFLGCNRYIFEYSVLVSPMQNVVRKGEVFKARIWLAHADDKYDHRQKKIFIDNTEFAVLAGEYADYVSEPVFENEKIINITAFIQDPLTGRMEPAFLDFEYVIRTE